MAINIIGANLSDAFRLLYTDKMTIERFGAIMAEDGTINYHDPNGVVTIAQNEPCRLSIKTLDTPPEMTEAQGDLQIMQYKVFCHSDIDVQAGDMISVTRKSGTDQTDIIEGVAGQPAIFLTHKEILLTQRERG